MNIRLILFNMENQKKALEVIKTEGMKGFMKRWREGIAQVSPLQQTDTQILFTYITLIGIAAGFGITLANFKGFWWLTIILGAAFGNTLVGLLALKQKQKLLESFEIKEDEKEVTQ